VIDLCQNRLLGHDVLNLLEANHLMFLQHLKSVVFSVSFVLHEPHAPESASPCAKFVESLTAEADAYV
jgi:hypothetical protein